MDAAQVVAFRSVQCRRCLAVKPQTVENFTLVASGTVNRKLIFKRVCRNCASQQRVEWRRKNRDADNAKRRLRHKPDVMRRYNLKRFGLTPEQYQAIHGAQNGLCAICAKPERRLMRERPTSLAVDHDHETGRVRGLLCAACNTAIGQLQDNSEIAAKAAAYLKRNGK